MTLGAVVLRPGLLARHAAWPSCLAAVVAAGLRRRGQRPAHRAGQDHRLHRHARHPLGGLRAGADPLRRQAGHRHRPALLELSTGGSAIFGWSFLIAAVVAVVAHVVLFHTRFGTHVLATGGSAEAATRHRHQHQRDQDRRLHDLRRARRARRDPAGRPRSAPPSRPPTPASCSTPSPPSCSAGSACSAAAPRIIGPVIGALLLTALVNGLTLLGVSQFYQPLAVGIVVVLAALLTRFQR